MSYVLVTGGAGFIGANLCRELLKRGESVICADNYCTGSYANVSALSGKGGFKAVEADITDPAFERIAAAAAGTRGIKRIYHLACPASPVHYQKDPIMTARTCFEGSLNVLKLARDTGARVLLASTSEVYGDPLEHPQKESYRGNVNPDGPRACYDEGKRIAETLFFDAKRKWNVDIRVVRIFNTYGPFMAVSDGRVVSNFINQALKGKPLTIYGDGLQTRSFMYVDDLIRGLLGMMEQTVSSGPVNLGNPEEHTMLEAAEMVKMVTGSASELVFEPLPKDDPTRRRPDITLARELFGFSPSTSFFEGLRKTCGYFHNSAMDIDFQP